MKRLTYSCLECGQPFDLYFDDLEKTPENCECGSKIGNCRIQFKIRSKPKGYTANITYAENERYSVAMGVQPEQIAEAERTFPGSEYHPKTGDLLIKNRAHKLKEMKRRGYAEFDDGKGGWRKHGHQINTKRR